LTGVVHRNFEINLIFPGHPPIHPVSLALGRIHRSIQITPQAATYTSAVFINSRQSVANMMQSTSKHVTIPRNKTFSYKQARNTKECNFLYALYSRVTSQQHETLGITLIPHLLLRLIYGSLSQERQINT
jgi:hypothetical protein